MSWAATRCGSPVAHPVAIRAWSDGGLRDGRAGAGWILKAAWSWEDVGKDHWCDFACAALELGECTVTVAEIVGLTQAMEAVDSVLRTGHVLFSDHHRVRMGA